jgi:small subunit ribosomal protein S4
MYGMNDAQLKRFVSMATKMSGSNTENLLNLFESRIDNLVYRMGFAPTRRASRQLVTHGHITLNGKKLSIPSYICSVGDVIAVKSVSKNLAVVNTQKEGVAPIAFVKVNFATKEGTFVRLPERAELNKDLKEAYIIEYYNRLI